MLMAPVVPAAIEELAEHAHWVLWRYETVPGKDKPTKVPYRAVPDAEGQHARASSTDPTTWATAKAAKLMADGFDGIGFVVTGTEFCGIDLDDCIDPETNRVRAWAQAIVDRFASYTEITPSGLALRIWIRGALPPKVRRRFKQPEGGSLEIYDQHSAHYFTVTGQQWGGTPETIEARQPELEAWHRELVSALDPPRAVRDPALASASPMLDDDAVIAKARAAQNGDLFTALWAGSFKGRYASQSEADMALCAILAFWTRDDAAQIDRLFRQSALMRKKWDHHTSYATDTVAKVLGGTTYDPSRNGHGPVVMSPTPMAPMMAPTPSAPSADPLRAPTEALIGVGRSFAELYASYLESPLAFFNFCFLTYVGALIAPKVTLDSALHPEPRLYVVLIGESADTRKSTALDKTSAFFASLGDAYRPAELFGVGSAEGLAAELKESASLILVQDELKAFVDKAKHEGSIALPMVSTLFERGDYDNRTKEKKISVRGASFSLLSACTTETYAGMFDHRFFAIGFLNRLFLVSDRARRSHAVPHPIPPDSLETLRQQVRACLDQIDRAYVANGLRPVPYRLTPGALALFSDWYAARTGSIFEKRLDTYGHRLMLLLAATTGQDVIDEPIAAAVVALLTYQLEVRRELDPVDAENTIASLEEKIRRLLARGPLTGPELRRRAHYSRYGLWQWNAALTNVLTAGQALHERDSDLYRLAPVATIAPLRAPAQSGT